MYPCKAVTYHHVLNILELLEAKRKKHYGVATALAARTAEVHTMTVIYQNAHYETVMHHHVLISRHSHIITPSFWGS
jgi:hypothetical protein